MHLWHKDRVCTCSTVDKAGVTPRADTVYAVGSAVVGEHLDLSFYVYAAISIMYKISCGLCGGPTPLKG